MLAIRLGYPTSRNDTAAAFPSGNGHISDERMKPDQRAPDAAASRFSSTRTLEWMGDHKQIALSLHVDADDAAPENVAQGKYEGHDWLCCGALFDAVTHARVRPDAIIASVIADVEWLAAHCWGLYRFAVFRRRDAMLRLYIDPCGQRPVYFRRASSGGKHSDSTRTDEFGPLHIASDMRTLIGLAPQVAATPDMHFLHGTLLHGNGRESRTGLLGVDSVPIGCMLEVRHGLAPQLREVWRPLRGNSPYAPLRRIDTVAATTLPPRIDSAQRADPTDRLAARHKGLPIDAFRLLQTVTDRYLSTLPDGNIVLELSGGLESSALALALHEAGRTDGLTGINHFDRDSPASNEIVYAQAISDHCGFPLRTLPMDMTPYAPPMSTATMPQQPRPSQGSITLNWSTQLRERTSDLSSATHLNGYGGDAGFLAPPYFSTWLDAVHDGAWRRAMGAIHDMALLRRTPYWQVIRQGWKESRSRNLDSLISATPPTTLRMAQPVPAPDRFEYLPRLHAQLRRQPGKHMQLLGVIGNLAEIEMYPDLGFTRSFFPYLTQPMVEYVLNYPSYALYSRFHNRVPMRRAAYAASGLPHLWRRDKGETSGPFTRGWRENADHIRTVVMEGRCAQAGLVDRDACDRATRLAISGFRPPDLSLDRIYACEMFIQAWQGTATR
ncbi:hypothetical protein WM40_23435 [Robbsia andropogonis]|uniref:Asparagine synthetase domain-containing protein n=1 Tax=Robbsia andropogonis TaxID=28092 RepID=A0A0F5JUR6_9BURK|nr:hypothetical protein [Robbsia andropogonis]KKB61389.1 hypothetical protein WM40_23435 [Robbsia andropogonis]